jgi:arylsulfatase I/J
VRVNTFVNGGLLPAARRGVVSEDFVAIEDWYTTFCSLAGVDPSDKSGVAAGLPDYDGYDLWPYFSGANATGPRSEIWLGSGKPGDSDNSANPMVQSYIRSDGWKIIYGSVIEDAWTGPFYPNASTNWCDTCPYDCGTIDAPTCLFNVFKDPTEHNNAYKANPDIVTKMAARLKELEKGIFAPDRGSPDSTDACKASKDGWVRPFLP